jgi:hypothetical protein
MRRMLGSGLKFSLSIFALTVAAGATLTACPSVPPPKFPAQSGQAALERLVATQACGLGVQGTAKIDHFGKQGRFRGKLLFFAVAPENLEMEAQSPFGVNLATLASNGNRFSFLDLREKAFLVGPASACNIARLTSVPIPGHALVNLLRGLPPVLRHEHTTFDWDTAGYYTVRIQSTREASEELRIAPHPEDLAKPWAEQRMRLLNVRVTQYGGLLYEAELSEHAPGKMATARPTDPETGEPGIKPSGPVCHAEIPKVLRLKVPASDVDVVFRYEDAEWNPPLPAGVFELARPPAMREIEVDCPGEAAQARDK